MPATPPPRPEDLAKYPKMTSWFRPYVLAKLLWRVIVSDLFGQYADRRLVVVALDTVSDQELVERAQQFIPGKGSSEAWRLDPDSDGAIWIDYVADLGDGFDVTYAVASLLSAGDPDDWRTRHAPRSDARHGRRRGLSKRGPGDLSEAVTRSLRLGVSGPGSPVQQRAAGLRNTW